MGGARSKKKMKKKLEFKMSQLSTSEIMAGLDFCSEDIVRLKVTLRKGARIESVSSEKVREIGK